MHNKAAERTTFLSREIGTEITGKPVIHSRIGTAPHPYEDETGGPIAVVGSFSCGVKTKVLLPFLVIVALTEIGPQGGHFFVFGSGFSQGGQLLTLKDSMPHAHIAP